MGVFVELRSTNTPKFLVLREYTLENRFYGFTLPFTITFLSKYDKLRQVKKSTVLRKEVRQCHTDITEKSCTFI